MKISIEVDWNDLNSDAQERMICQVIEERIKDYQSEGELLLKREWYEPKPKTWQEAYVRDNGINEIMWGDYDRKIEDAEVPKDEDWNYWLREYLEDEVETECYRAMKHNEIEVEL